MSDFSPIEGLEALVTKCVNIAMEVSFTRSELNNGALEIRRRLTRLRLTSRTTSVGSKCMSRTGQQFFK